MVLMFEEIVVEFVAIAASLAALACLIYFIAVTFLEKRELRRLESARRREWESDRSTQPPRPDPRPRPALASGTLTTSPVPARRADGVSRP